MSSGNIQLPSTTPSNEAHRQLISAGFDKLAGDPERPHTEMWKNRYGKVVYVDYTDDTFKECWTETLRLALECKDTIPAHPWSPLWQALLGPRYRPW